jgi:hypothetical protein
MGVTVAAEAGSAIHTDTQSAVYQISAVKKRHPLANVPRNLDLLVGSFMCMPSLLNSLFNASRTGLWHSFTSQIGIQTPYLLRNQLHF